jgi:protein CpxP
MNSSKRRVSLVAIAGSLAVLLGGALAFAHSGGGHHGMMSGNFTEDHLEHVQTMLGKIGASDAQKTQIEAILKPALQDMAAEHDVHFAALKQFHEAIAAPSIDRARLESLRAEQMKLLDDCSKRLVTAVTDAAEVLSPDQRAALAREIEKHHHE